MLKTTVDRFLTHLRRTKSSPLTVANYQRYLARFVNFADDSSLDAITPELLSAYSEHLAGESLKKVSINYHKIALRRFLKYLGESGLSGIDWRSIALAKQAYRPPTPLEILDVDKLLKLPDVRKTSGLRDRAILELLYSTGVLVSELIRLDRGDVKVKRLALRIIGKHGGERQIELSDRAAYWLEQYLRTRDDVFQPLFIRYQGIMDLTDEGAYMRLTSRSVERIVAKYARQAGLASRVTPHVLRHTRAKALLAAGANWERVRQALDHRSVVTTRLLYEETKKT